MRRGSTSARSGIRSSRRRAGVVWAVILVFIISTTIAVAYLRDQDGIATDCTAYGVPANDPRASAPEISLIADEETEEQNRGSSRTPRMLEHNWGETVDGVVLGQVFRHDEIRSRYHMFTRGIDFNKPVGLFVRLHGDGAFEYDYPDGLTNCLAVIAASQNMITLVPRTPDNITYTWWQSLSDNLRWLTALIDQVESDFAVDNDNIWWMGYSGGAELLSYGLIPRSPELVTGGAVMVGGGGAPSSAPMTVPRELRANMGLFWITGRRDDGTDSREPFDAVAAAEAGSAWYRRHGFANVHTEFPADHDHFSLPEGQIILSILDEAAAAR